MKDRTERIQQKDRDEAAEWGIEVEQLPRWKVLYEAYVQDPQISVLLRYMLISGWQVPEG